MTRPELHALVDIVMDAREMTGLDLQVDLSVWHFKRNSLIWNKSSLTTKDSDFTKSVKEYIKTLEK